MCGIAAEFWYGESGGRVDVAKLERARERMKSRGPDGAGLWVSPDQRVGLAHRRLAILDLRPEANQPMSDDTGQLWVVFNGEIYNFRDLRRDLEVRGYRFRTTSDTDVLLKGWAEYGAGVLPRLRGMFAFAVWDGRERCLYAGRDPFGIKPLYYADDGKCLRLASQVRALLTWDEIDTRLNPAGHVGFMLWGHVPDPFTLYEGITALPAGALLICKPGQGVRVESYSDIARIVVEGHRSKREVSSGELRETLEDSVRHHLIAGVPVGLFLSSGVDSTHTGMVAAKLHPRIVAVTLGLEEYKGTPADETVWAQRTARQHGMEHKVVWSSQSDADLEKVLAAMDQPSIDGVNTYLVSQAAAAVGLKVALSGLGGDELLGGYATFGRLPALARFLRTGPLGRTVLRALARLAPRRQRAK